MARRRATSKSKKRPVFKGVDYIASKLSKYYPKRYSSKTVAKSRAREINKELGALGLRGKGTLKNIYSVERIQKGKGARRKKKGKSMPNVPPEMLAQTFYFNLQDYPDFIEISTNEIWYTSKLWDAKLNAVQGGSRYDYVEYFAPYVNFINTAA